MPTISWPTDRLFNPALLEWGETRILRRSGGGPLGPSIQTIETPYSHRWTATITLRRAASYAERAQQEALISRVNLGTNRVALYHFAHPNPYGTMRGSPTMASTATQGATTLAITTTAGATLLAGDMISVTAGGSAQLVRVAESATANGSGAMTVSITPALRGSVSSGSTVVWDKPTALFLLSDSSWSSSFSPGEAQPLTLSFVEVLA